MVFVLLIDGMNKIIIRLYFFLRDKSKFGSEELPVEGLRLEYISVEIFFETFPSYFNFAFVDTAIFHPPLLLLLVTVHIPTPSSLLFVPLPVFLFAICFFVALDHLLVPEEALLFVPSSSSPSPSSFWALTQVKTLVSQTNTPAITVSAKVVGTLLMHCN